MNIKETINGLTQEIRRGTIIIANGIGRGTFW